MPKSVFLKLPPIKGDSTEQGHQGEIEILSYSYSPGQPGTLTQDRLKEVDLTYRQGEYSPFLMEACASQRLFPSAVVTATYSKDGAVKGIMRINMKGVTVASFRRPGSSGKEIPIESITLDFADVEIQYL
jgi:type VI secretion system secreted protein Hcp